MIVLTNPWRWIVFGLSGMFVLIGVSIFADSGAIVTHRTVNYIVGIVVIVVPALFGIVHLRQRVVLGGENMKVRRGLRTTRISRDEIDQASYVEARHRVAGYLVAFPLLEKSDGRVEKLRFLEHPASGEGAARVDGYVGEINAWLTK